MWCQSIEETAEEDDNDDDEGVEREGVERAASQLFLTKLISGRPVELCGGKLEENTAAPEGGRSLSLSLLLEIEMLLLLCRSVSKVVDLYGGSTQRVVFLAMTSQVLYLSVGETRNSPYAEVI